MSIFSIKKPGSVTVFLTMMFFLIFSLVGVTYDCTRIGASRGYVKVAGASAARTVYGNYNRELFREYGLLGYGGYDGRGEEDLNREFQEVLEENLKTSRSNALSSEANLYRLKNVAADTAAESYVTDKKVFYSQITAYLKSKALSDTVEMALDKVGASVSGRDLQGKLDMARKYESGEYEALQEDGSENDPKHEAECEGGSKKDKGKNTANDNREEKREDSAGGNPLTAFSHMVRDGVLGMVCGDRALSEGTILPREEERREEEQKEVPTGASEFLQQFLGENNALEDDSALSRGKNKMLLLAYSRETLSDYLSQEGEGVQYALEYLAAGKTEEKSNLSSVVNRLLTTRTLLNFAYVVSDPVLQEKSLATATALAGFTGLPPVITGVQYAILLILSFQEACVDVTALLDGRSVPVVKNQSNFQMKYEEICLGSKSLFRKKAQRYKKEKAQAAGSISYREYLTFFLLLVGEEKLRNRTLDVIQQNLREKYNQSFCIDDCICRSVFRISYNTGYLFCSLPLWGGQWGGAPKSQRQEVDYGYQSG